MAIKPSQRNYISYYWVMKCEKVNEDGLSCQKSMYEASNGEFWDHAGGHFFATDQLWEKLKSDHFNNEALLSGLPAESHPASECSSEFSYCAWRFPPKARRC